MERKLKVEKRGRRHKRVRARVTGTVLRPRLCVFKSHRHIYAQLIDDEKGQVLLSASDRELKSPSKKTSKRSQEALKIKGSREKLSFEVGKLIAQKALKKKIAGIVFDRGGYQYHGRVKYLAEGVRETGLKF